MGKCFCDPVSHLQTRGDSYKEFSESCEVFILFKLVARLKDKTPWNGIGGEHCAFTICKRVCNYVVYLLPAYKTATKNILYAEKAKKKNLSEVTKSRLCAGCGRPILPRLVMCSMVFKLV